MKGALQTTAAWVAMFFFGAAGIGVLAVYYSWFTILPALGLLWAVGALS